MGGTQRDTIEKYHELMRLNASAHVLRTGIELGVLDQLAEGQKQLDALAGALSIQSQRLALLLDCLVELGLLERYNEYFALSPVARLLCDHDRTLGDIDWFRAARRLQGEPVDVAAHRRHLDRAAATQWVHTPTAMQTAAVLAELELPPEPEIVDLGCGSGVWSSALAYRVEGSRVTAVDRQNVLEAAEKTAESVELHPRWRSVPIDDSPAEAEIPDDFADIVILGCRLHPESGYEARRLLAKAAVLLKPGGWLAIIDYFPPQEPTLDNALRTLRVDVATPEGAIRDCAEVASWIEVAGFDDPQFTYLSASTDSMGLLVGRRRK